VTTQPARARATQLRLLATRLDAAALHDAWRMAGPLTWRGSHVDPCADDLRRLLRRLADVADDLRRTAARLELEAAAGGSSP
jgi:hypothetical protein